MKIKKPPRKYPQMLEALIPDPQIAVDYIRRDIHGHEDFHMLDYARMEGINIIFEGPTGAGKTMLARAYAAERQIPFLSLNPGSAAEPTMLFGKHLLLDNGMYWVDGLVTAAVRFGDCVLDLDEVNFMPHGVTSNLHSLCDAQRYITLYDNVIEFDDPETGERHGLPEIVRAQPGLLILAAYNEGYRGTEELNEAFRNRFDIPVRWDYSDKVEEDLVASSTLRSIAKEIRKLNSTGEILTPCSTNRLQFFERMVEDIGLSSAISNFLCHFDPSERDAVKNILDLNHDRLWNDYEKANNRDPNKGYFVTEED